MSDGAATRWSHVALSCRDLAATEDFYRRWFGFERAAAFPLGDTQVVFLRRGGAYLELFSAGDGSPAPDGPTAPGQIRHLALATDDIDSVIERMGDAAHVTLGPLSFDQFIHGWRSVWLTDPDGTVVEVSEGYHDKEPEQ